MRYYFILILFISLSLQLNAQNKDDYKFDSTLYNTSLIQPHSAPYSNRKIKKVKPVIIDTAVREKRNSYSSIKIHVSLAPFWANSGELQVNIPCTSVQNNVYNNSSITFNKNFFELNPLIAGLGVEEVYKKGYGELDLYKKKGTIAFSLGGGVRFLNKKETMGIKLGFNIAYGHREVPMGSLDFRNKHIIIDGNSFAATFTNTTTTKNALGATITNTTTYNSEYIGAIYEISSFSIAPKVSLLILSKEQRISLRLISWYNFNIISREKLYLEQYDNAQHRGTTMNYKLNKKQKNYQFDGSNPIDLRKLIIGLELGILLGSRSS